MIEDSYWEDMDVNSPADFKKCSLCKDEYHRKELAAKDNLKYCRCCLSLLHQPNSVDFIKE